MRSRLLQNLEAIINSTQDGVEWARSMSRQATYFARQGETDQAMRTIEMVRSRFGASLVPEVAVWLMLAEGILAFSTVDFLRFTDRARRAHGIARAAGYDIGRATCAAWLALSALNDRRYEEMVTLLVEAFRYATKDNHQARARASLVLADSFHLAGRFDLARPWYEATRQHALADGDEATFSAMLFNVASFRGSNVKLASALGDLFEEEAHRAALEARSAAAFDLAIGAKSFNQFLPHLVAQLLIAEGRYEEAFDQLKRMDLNGLPAWGHAAHYADYTFCAWQLDNHETVEQVVPKALAALERPVDPDDAAYACCRLAFVATAAGNGALAATLQARAREEATRYRAFQTNLAAKLLAVSSTASEA